MTTTDPCRLFVFLARDAPLAAVLRRGPSAWARLSLWHTDSDTFEHGQWFRGRIYERRCDISPDGRLFAYFARKSVTGRPDSWIAVSRTPWFTALALWFIGGTYCAGALFPDRRRLFLGGLDIPPDEGALPRWLTVTKDAPYIDRTNNWTERTVYFNRLLRDGWRPLPDVAAPVSWERPSLHGRGTLIMLPRSDRDFRAYGGPHVIDYALRIRRDEIPLGRGTWADWDHRGRLILARDGRLLHWRGGDEHEIADFNPQTPEPAPSPAEARAWPPPRNRNARHTPP